MLSKSSSVLNQISSMAWHTPVSTKMATFVGLNLAATQDSHQVGQGLGLLMWGTRTSWGPWQLLLGSPVVTVPLTS